MARLPQGAVLHDLVAQSTSSPSRYVCAMNPSCALRPEKGAGVDPVTGTSALLRQLECGARL